MSGGLCLLRRVPVTVTFLVLLAFTTGLLAFEGGDARLRVLQQSSTNLDHLSRDPLRVLALSALWVSPDDLVLLVPLTAALFAAVERRVGSRRLLGVFAAGHVGATLLAALGIWLGIRAGTVAPSVAHSLDVGISYGTYAVAAYAVTLLPRRLAVAAAGALGAWLAWAVADGRTFTDFGHLFALGIGLALGLGGRLQRPRLAVALAVVLLLAAPLAALVEQPRPAQSSSAPHRAHQ
jgi:hypothetical protein